MKKELLDSGVEPKMLHSYIPCVGWVESCLLGFNIKWFGQLFVIRQFCMNKKGLNIIHAILDCEASNTVDLLGNNYNSKLDLIRREFSACDSLSSHIPGRSHFNYTGPLI